MHYCFVAQQSHLYRAMAHGIVEVHGSLCFSGSVKYLNARLSNAIVFVISQFYKK
jgi:hypothetical protein